MDRPQRPSQFGPYLLLYPLGTGGMGQVFLARQRGEHGIQRLVAVKRILVHLTRDRKLVDLFLDEVRIAAQLSHGNIVQVIDHGVIDGQYFMAMEYVHGENLMEVLSRLTERGQRLPLDLALHIASGICAGLDYAHRKPGLDGQPLGIVHRDISPHNVLLSFQGEVKIADFGVAHAAEQTHQTLGGELRGKLAYMSPEQAYGRTLDQRSDIFSLGVVLYEMLTGHSPLRRDSPMATLEAVRTVEISPLAETGAELPVEVCELLQRTLSLEADARPDSARTLYEELQLAMRLHGLVASAFDVADYLQDLFPESRGDQSQPSVRTAPGRRADELAACPSGREVDERRTIHYLQQRHRDPEALVSTPAVTVDPRAPRAARWLAAAGVIGVVASVGLVGAGLYYRRAGSTTARSDGRAPVAAVHLDHGASPRRAEARAVSPREAELSVRSAPPGAWVTIDGARQPGVTPLVLRLAPGEHACVVGLKGHRSWRGRVTLRPGEPAALQPRLESFPALLAVRSSHPCRLRINGQAAGQTPLAERMVPAGALELRCQEPGGAVATRRVRAVPGETIRVTLGFGVLDINVEPWAEVTVDAARRGPTPLRLLLAEGEHRVELRNTGKGLRRSTVVTVSSATPTRISSW